MMGTSASATVGAGPRNAMASTSATDDNDRRRTGKATVLISLTVAKPASKTRRSSGCHCAGVETTAAATTHVTSTAAWAKTSAGRETRRPSLLGSPTSATVMELDDRDGPLPGHRVHLQPAVGRACPVLDQRQTDMAH